MTGCSRCGSAAINPFSHGRDPAKDLHLCDVCYWRERAEEGRAEDLEEIDQLTDKLADARRDVDNYQVDYKAAQEKIDDLEKEIAELQEEMNRREAQIDELLADITDLKA